jgi:drug/metabolite transporter (DMT)-like permease
MPNPPARKLLPLVLLLTLVWGTNWALFPIAVREVSVWTFRSSTMVAAGLLLLAYARMRGIPIGVPRGQRLPLALAAVSYFCVWNIASTYSAILIPSGQAAILGFTMPMWSALFAWMALGERPSPRLAISLVLACVGVGLLAWAARGAYSSAPLGFVLGISAGVGWAVGTLILKRSGVSVPAVVSTGWQLLVAAVPLGAGALVLGTREPFIPSWTTIVVITYITLVPLAVGNALWFSIVGMLPASVSGMSAVMVPMVAMVTGAIVHGEPLGPLELGAMACSFAGLLLALVRPARSSA